MWVLTKIVKTPKKLLLLISNSEFIRRLKTERVLVSMRENGERSLITSSLFACKLKSTKRNFLDG